MVVLISSIILVLSSGGIAFVLAKKIPILIQLPEVHEGIQKENILNPWIKKIKSISLDKIIVLKSLSKVRVWVLKLEKHIDNLLQGMRRVIIQKKVSQDKDKTPKLPPTPPI